MNRGSIGSMPAATERDDEAYLEFVESLRGFTIGTLNKAADGRATAAVATLGHVPADIAEVRETIDGVPIVAALNRFMRSSQEMMWSGVIDTYRKREAEFIAALDASDRMGPGSVTWDPTFRYPRYILDHEIHIQPGSYHDDPLAGYIYHYGTKVFFTGRNDSDGLQRGMANNVPLPADGQVRRVLDLACSVGQTTTAFKERFPSAEVWGIDAGAPMVRYAHKRAVEMGLDVHFKQALVEDNGFPDASFDMAHSFLLYHELPLGVQAATAREVARVLRPGGVYAIHDLGVRPMNLREPLRDYMTYFNRDDNGEPFIVDFTYSDFVGTLKSAGFRSVETDSRAGGLPRWIAIR